MKQHYFYPTLLFVFAIFFVSAQSPAVPGCQSKFTLYADTAHDNRYYAVEASTGTRPITYNWGWGDNTYSQGQYVSHTYLDTGTYILCLYITDTLSCNNLFCDSNVHITIAGTTISTVPQVPAGIRENGAWDAGQVNVFPNPTTGILTIQTGGFAPSLVSVYDMSGRKVREEKFVKRIDVSGLLPGIYFVELSDGGELVRRRFVKE